MGEGQRYVTDVRVRYSDLDAQGHVNNARVLRYLAKVTLEPAITRKQFTDAITAGIDKIEATIHNARTLVELDTSFSDLLWSFAPDDRPAPVNLADVPSQTPESTAMSKELKRRGFRFVGPTTAYALMQATGMVDDHLAGCAFRPSA